MLPLFILTALPLVLATPCCRLVSPKAAVSTTASTALNGSSEVVAASWYAGWHGADFPPENITWSKYNSVIYAFATTTSDASVISLDSSDEQILPRFVSLAHQNGVKASLSIGGWTGSQYFSDAVATSSNQSTFVKAVLGLVSQYGLDGIEFDWEYPNRQGVGCNTISPNDSTNFLSFLQQLRANPAGKNLTLSAAVSLTPFAGSNGTPMTDVSQFAEVLDYIELMVYDVFGSFSSTVGPNAPLNDTCATIKEGSTVSGVQAWTAAKFPANQIILGVPSYGHSFYVTTSAAIDGSGGLALYPQFDASLQPHGDSWDAAAGVDQCGNPTPVGGIFDFWGLVQGGFLTTNGTPASGIDYTYDNCSQTPYVYNPNSHAMVSYDNAQSFAAKGQFINDAGLAGFAMYQTGGDYDDILLDSITNAIGIEAETC